MEEEVSS